MAIADGAGDAARACKAGSGPHLQGATGRNGSGNIQLGGRRCGADADIAGVRNMQAIGVVGAQGQAVVGNGTKEPADGTDVVEQFGIRIAVADSHIGDAVVGEHGQPAADGRGAVAAASHGEHDGGGGITNPHHATGMHEQARGGGGLRTVAHRKATAHFQSAAGYSRTDTHVAALRHDHPLATRRGEGEATIFPCNNVGSAGNNPVPQRTTACCRARG